MIAKECKKESHLGCPSRNCKCGCHEKPITITCSQCGKKSVEAEGYTNKKKMIFLNNWFAEHMKKCDWSVARSE